MKIPELNIKMVKNIYMAVLEARVLYGEMNKVGVELIE
jgi:hypothetical protein